MKTNANEPDDRVPIWKVIQVCKRMVLKMSSTDYLSPPDVTLFFFAFLSALIICFCLHIPFVNGRVQSFWLHLISLCAGKYLKTAVLVFQPYIAPQTPQEQFVKGKVFQLKKKRVVLNNYLEREKMSGETSWKAIPGICPISLLPEKLSSRAAESQIQNVKQEGFCNFIQGNKERN